MSAERRDHSLGNGCYYQVISDAGHQPQQRTLYWRTPTIAAIRQGDWKLITDRNHQKPQLFHLAEDPYEQHDLAVKEPQRVDALLKLLAEHRTGDWTR